MTEPEAVNHPQHYGGDTTYVWADGTSNNQGVYTMRVSH